jgi:hypothetical protein
MRIRFGDLRDIARHGASWRPRSPNAVVIAPTSIRTKAIEIYHDEGQSAALDYMDGRRPHSRGLSGYYGSGGKRPRQGQRTREAIGRYFQYDVEDGRPVAELGVTGEVTIGPHVVSTTVDVVVFAAQEDGYEYSGRVLLWDLAGGSESLSELIAVPAVLLIDKELGEDTCGDIEVWDLENGTRWRIGRRHALSNLSRVTEMLDRAGAALT